MTTSVAVIKRPWPPKEVALLGTKTDREVAEKIGRSVDAVKDKRVSLGIPSIIKQRVLTKAEKKLLGTSTDADIAARLGVHRVTITKLRAKLGIPKWDGS